MADRYLDPSWVGMEGIFGGYVLAVAVDAVRLEGYRPQSVTLAFVSTVEPGDTELVVDAVHRGRSTASLRITIRQAGRLRAHGLASLVRPGGESIWSTRVDPISWGVPEATPVLVPPYRTLPYLGHLEQRSLAVDPIDDASVAWVRTTSVAGAGLDPYARLALFLDVLPPGLFRLDPRPSFVPSLELTVHFMGGVEPVTDPTAWFMVRNQTVWSSREFCVDEGTLHDHTGVLLAQLRQGRAVRW